MERALRLAFEAAEAGEVPIGAVIARNGVLLGQSGNQTETLKDPTAHAEILAITQAAAALGNWRLSDCTLYVTKEPCVMCAGAIVQARISRVVWGVSDPERGGQSRFGILNSPQLHHRPALVADVLGSEARELLLQFFRQRRAESNNP